VLLRFDRDVGRTCRRSEIGPSLYTISTAAATCDSWGAEPKLENEHRMRGTSGTCAPRRDLIAVG
jgi:hypothetical protein